MAKDWECPRAASGGGDGKLLHERITETAQHALNMFADALRRSDLTIAEHWKTNYEDSAGRLREGLGVGGFVHEQHRRAAQACLASLEQQMEAIKAYLAALPQTEPVVVPAGHADERGGGSAG